MKALITAGRLLRPPWRCVWAYEEGAKAGFLGLFGQFFLIYNGADNAAYPFPLAMLLLALWYLLLLGLVLWWSGNGAAWDDRHRIALVNGALTLLLALGPLTAGKEYPVMYVSHPVFLVLLWLAGRKVRRRVTNEGQRGPGPKARPAL